MHAKSFVTAFAMTALLALGGFATAQGTDTGAAPQAGTVAPETMSIAQIIEHLASLGYRDVKEVERKSDKLYEIEARDPKGAWVELAVDARSGEILRTKLDD